MGDVFGRGARIRIEGVDGTVVQATVAAYDLLPKGLPLGHSTLILKDARVTQPCSGCGRTTVIVARMPAALCSECAR
jgi:hypothetical protein